MLRVFDQVRTFAPTSEPVLLMGESGVGKEGLARALHFESGRTGAFVAVNCGAIPFGLAESELFGHYKGAFTGATEDRLGAFGAADRGTLFLDEVGELSLDLQPRLLRALEASAVRAVGSTSERPVDVRIVAATHCPLPDMVRRGHFRRDLFHRICVLPILVPALRERPEDIPDLIRSFLAPDVEVTEEAMVHLVSRPWTGNVRELRNALIRCQLLSTTRRIDTDALRELDTLDVEERPMGVRDAETRRLHDAVRSCGGNQARAARLLGMPKSTLGDRLRRAPLDGS